MATKKTDPLAGIPVTTASPARAAKAGVINLAAAKKKRLSGQDRKDAVRFARDMVGYDSTSPIFGKRLPALCGEIIDLIDAGDTLTAKLWLQELQKRVAFGQVMKAQS